MRISELSTTTRNVELVAIVISKGEIREVDTRYGSANVCDAVIDDGTGQIKWRLWRQQIQLVKIGDKVRIENGFIRTFYGEKVLNLGSDGSIIVLNRQDNNHGSMQGGVK